MAAPVTGCFSRFRPILSRQFICIHQVVADCHQAAASCASSSSQIIIPQKIRRSNTAILEALASTVKQDHYGPMYCFQDDPALIPAKNSIQKHYLFAKASGRKAARYVIERYPRYFIDIQVDPPVAGLEPPCPPAQPADTEAGVQERVALHKVLAAYDAYKECREKDVALSDVTTSELLELCCAYNSADPQPTLEPEERLWKKDNLKANHRGRTWESQGAAETIFNQIEEPRPQDYRALIRGRAKFKESNGAFKLYSDARSKGIPLDIQTYNAVITISPFISMDHDEKLGNMQTVLSHMITAGVAPDADTITECLAVCDYCSQDGPGDKASRIAMQLMSSARVCGIEPSLGSYYYLLNTFLVLDTPNQKFSARLGGPVLDSTLDHLEGRAFTYQHPSDLNFFMNVMWFCEKTIDIENAKKVHALLNTATNHLLMGNMDVSSLYYQWWLKLICRHAHIDLVMTEFHKVYANKHFLPYNIVVRVMEVVIEAGAFHHVPSLWTEVLLWHRAMFMQANALIVFMGSQRQDVTLQQTFYDIAKRIFATQKKDRESTFGQVMEITGPVCSGLINIAFNSDDPVFAKELFNDFYEHRTTNSFSLLREDALLRLCAYLRAEQDLETLLNVLHMVAERAFPSFDGELQLLNDQFQLTEEQQQRVDDF